MKFFSVQTFCNARYFLNHVEHAKQVEETIPFIILVLFVTTSFQTTHLLLLDDTSWSGLDSCAEVKHWKIWNGKFHDLNDGTECQIPANKIRNEETGTQAYYAMIANGGVTEREEEETGGTELETDSGNEEDECEAEISSERADKVDEGQHSHSKRIES